VTLNRSEKYLEDMSYDDEWIDVEIRTIYTPGPDLNGDRIEGFKSK